MEFRDILSRPDPRGFYVIPAKPEAKSIAERYGALVEESGDKVLILVKSRSTAKKILHVLSKRGLLDA